MSTLPGDPAPEPRDARATATVGQVAVRIDRLAADNDRLIVGISGFCGAGKSTLARELATGAHRLRVRGDDFLDPVQSHRRSADWSGVERARLNREILIPFRAGASARFRRYDWAAGRLGPEQLLPPARVLIVDAIGLFHPECLDLLDLTVWVDVGLEQATAQGKARDLALGRRHGKLWDEVWMPNDRDFARRYDPRAAADILYTPDLCERMR
ncbi:phosphoglycerate transporter [Agromyces neolithicus]|uniref:AAA family ATPase n=1 Tax=Agromyces neolithicus TaxID=269420 RepID=A0ABP4Y945_9MICO